jgi:hypothetical protein
MRRILSQLADPDIVLWLKPRLTTETVERWRGVRILLHTVVSMNINASDRHGRKEGVVHRYCKEGFGNLCQYKTGILHQFLNLPHHLGSGNCAT